MSLHPLRSWSLTLALLACAASAQAQGTFRSMDIDPSIRAAGMGGASNAVRWGRGLNHWSNPALLGSEHGLSYEWAYTQLVPELASDVTFTSNVLKLAGGGTGFAISGKPFGGGIDLDYGISQGTDENGNPVGYFNSFESVDSWGFGVNAFELLSTIGSMGTRRLPLDDWFDVSFGMNFKEGEISLAPSPLGGARTRNHDWGAGARLTPIRVVMAGTLLQLDVSAGYSILNADTSERVSFFPGYYASPLSKHIRKGAAVRLQIDPPAWRSERRRSWNSWDQGFSPLFSLIAAADDVEISAGGFEPRYETTARGAELAIANMVFLRAGQYRDLVGDIDGPTYGWGFGLPFGKVAGIRYDGALVPQAAGLKDLERHGVTVWFNPLEIKREPQERRRYHRALERDRHESDRYRDERPARDRDRDSDRDDD